MRICKYPPIVTPRLERAPPAHQEATTRTGAAPVSITCCSSMINGQFFVGRNSTSTGVNRESTRGQRWSKSTSVSAALCFIPARSPFAWRVPGLFGFLRQVLPPLFALQLTVKPVPRVGFVCTAPAIPFWQLTRPHVSAEIFVRSCPQGVIRMRRALELAVQPRRLLQELCSARKLRVHEQRGLHIFMLPTSGVDVDLVCENGTFETLARWGLAGEDAVHKGHPLLLLQVDRSHGHAAGAQPSVARQPAVAALLPCGRMQRDISVCNRCLQ